MSTAPTTTTRTTRSTARTAAARGLLAQAGAAAGVDSATCTSDNEITATNRDFGRALPAFGDATAEAVEDAGEALGLSLTAEAIRQKATRVEDLEAFRDDAEQLFLRATQAWNVARTELGADVAKVLQAADAVALHPGIPDDKKEKVARAARTLFTLREARKAEANGARQITRTTNEHQSDQAAATTRIAALETELAQTRLENRILGGKPAPTTAAVTAPAPATVAVATAAARRGRRTGRRG